MRDFGIVTLTRFPKIFKSLDSSLSALNIIPRKQIVVTSGPAKLELVVDYKNWTILQGKEPFSFSRNINLALSALSLLGGMDILLTNDDVLFTNAITPVINIVEENPSIGIISPQVIGGVGNLFQSSTFKIINDYIISAKRLAFVCVYIRKEVFEEIGFFDEHTFSSDEIEYGSEDDDFCLRAQQKGFKLAVTPKMVVKHGFEQYEYSSSYLQVMSVKERNKSMSRMQTRLAEKWN